MRIQILEPVAGATVSGLLALLTPVRISELLEATWNEIDFENTTWTIPKERMKRRNPHVIW